MASRNSFAVGITSDNNGIIISALSWKIIACWISKPVVPSLALSTRPNSKIYDENALAEAINVNLRA